MSSRTNYLLTDGVGREVSSATSLASSSGNIELNTVIWNFEALVVEFVLREVTGHHNQDTLSINHVVESRIEASETISVSIVESIAKRGDVKASFIDFVLSGSTHDHWRNTHSVDDSAGIVLASQTGSSKVVIISTGFINWEAISKVEILTVWT